MVSPVGSVIYYVDRYPSHGAAVRIKCYNLSVWYREVLDQWWYPLECLVLSHETQSVVLPGLGTYAVRTLAGWPLGKSLSLSGLVPS